MSEEENSLTEPKLKIVTRVDRVRDKQVRKERFQAQIDTLLRQGKISEVMARNFVELLDINPAYYWPRKYRYTIEPEYGIENPLTVQQRNHFERNGYLVVKNVVSKDLLKLIKECPKHSIGEVLRLIINNREIVKRVRSFCGKSSKHIATVIIDSQSFQSKKNELNQELNSFAKLAQHFYQLNVHPADRLIGCLICVENTNQLSICLEPASHQSSVLEIEMRGPDGQLVKKIYEKPIRTLEKLNEHPESRQIIALQPGDVFFYHPLLAQSILFESQTTETEIFLENLTSNLTEHSDAQVANHILALNAFYGSADLTKVTRNWSSQFMESANFKTSLESLKLLDQLLEQNQALEEENEQLKEENKALDQVVHERNDLKSLNVQIYIGNSIVNLEQVLADADQEQNFPMKSHL